jgi:2-oxo-4-hydroxy-4-carboxy-5-ureidoimidazoline decarboxylase
MDGLAWLNAADSSEATAALMRTCGSSTWAARMEARRPFRDREDLLAAAVREWAASSRADVIEAFSHHPRIGDRESLRARFPATHGWSGDEQKSASAASEATLDDLARANQAYEEKFGHIFIVCATGKSAPEMLELLRSRMSNDAEAELVIAAGEQAKITRLRLEKLLAELPAESNR